MPFRSKKVPENLIPSGFATFSVGDLNKITSLLDGETKYYMQGEEIKRYSKLKASFAGIVAEGKVNLLSFDDKGTLIEKEALKRWDVVGEVFGFAPLGVSYVLSAESDCNIIFFPPQKLFASTETKYKELHLQFLSEIMRRLSLRVQKREERLFILKRHSLREKLLAYLKTEEKKSGVSSFRIKLSQEELAAYLIADRSALAREIANLNKEGIIKSKGRRFEFL